MAVYHCGTCEKEYDDGEPGYSGAASAGFYCSDECWLKFLEGSGNLKNSSKNKPKTRKRTFHFTERELYLLRLAMHMADEEGGWEYPHGDEAQIEVEKLYQRLGGQIRPVNFSFVHPENPGETNEETAERHTM